MTDMLDVSDTIKAKSDQLNADDLLPSPITVQVTGVRKVSGDQPVVISISGGHLPWKPCKTTRRVLVHAWGKNALEWVGRWLVLYRDEKVKWAGVEAGGIRIRAMSHIPGPLSLSLNETKKSKKIESVAVLHEREFTNAGAPTANLDSFLAEIGLTVADVDRWLTKNGTPTVDKRSPVNRSKLAAALASDAAKVDEIRALIPTQDDKPASDTTDGTPADDGSIP